MSDMDRLLKVGVDWLRGIDSVADPDDLENAAKEIERLISENATLKAQMVVMIGIIAELKMDNRKKYGDHWEDGDVFKEVDKEGK